MMQASVLQGERHDVTFSTIHEAFEYIVRHNNEARATGIRFENCYLDYVEVSRLSTKLCHILFNRLLFTTVATSTEINSPYKIIAVDNTPSHQLIVCLLAILKLGYAYLPINSGDPDNFVKKILNESKATTIIAPSESYFITEKDTTWSRYNVLNLDELLAEAANLIEDILADQEYTIKCSSKLAIVIYTSGSTGVPKGVRLSHRALLNRLIWQWKQFPFCNGDIGCFKTSLTFVDSVAEIFGCVLKLVPLVIAPKNIQLSEKAFSTFLKKNYVSRLVIVPSLLRNLCNYLQHADVNEQITSIKLCVCSGEILMPDLAIQFFEKFPKAQLANFYGSSEVMADVTFETFASKEEVIGKCYMNKLSIGKPIHNSTVYLLNEARTIVPRGDVGEIFVSGQCLADGFINENLSQVLFKQHSFEGFGHEILFQTGDFANIVDNRLIFEGRKDNLVKILGKKVNLNEVGDVIRRFNKVKECIVLYIQSNALNQNSLVAFYTLNFREENNDIVTVENEITKLCRKYLLLEALPTLHYVDEIPLQGNSAKVDRLKLIDKYNKSLSNARKAALIQMNDFNVNDLIMNVLACNLNSEPGNLIMSASFVAQGGNSLKIMQTRDTLRDYMSLDIPIELFAEPFCLQDIINVCHGAHGEPQKYSFLPPKTRFTSKPFNEIQNPAKLLDICAQSFSFRNPLDLSLGITFDDDMAMCRYAAEMDYKRCLSFAVFDYDSEQLMGGAFLFDMFVNLEPATRHCLHPLNDLFHQLEQPYLSTLSYEDTSTIMNCFLICTDIELSVAKQLRICYFIEETVLQVARDHGFKRVLSTNSNPVTQV